ncbi:MAG: glycosyltransferase family A protein [Pyrinomonadaceae bacterium]
MSAAEENSKDDAESRVSVFVPCYNHDPFIERCLRSIFAQTLAPKHLLVIDDGSTDDSKQIIERVLRDCPFPSKLISRENRGLCATLNEAITHMDAEYFAYIGSDDVWFPDFLKERQKLLSTRPDAVLAYGNAYLIDEHDNVIESSTDWADAIYPDGDALPMLLLGTAPLSSTVFYRRAALETLRWNENSRLEDYELYLQLARDGEFAFDPKVLSAWRMHGYNVSGDLELILREVLSSQNRVASMMGWDSDKLASIQKRTRFHFAEEFLRKGFRTKAASLFVRGLSGAPSLKSIVRMVVLLLVPQTALRSRIKFNQSKSAERYGVINV